MTTDQTKTSDHEQRLGAALAACLEAMDDGRVPDRAELLARHPEFAAELGRFLDDQERVERCARPLRAAALGAAAGEALADQSQLGDFRIVREVGRGGMGVVYEAEQVSLGRRVALKVLPFAAAMDPRALQRFQNEARAAACLHHTNIVPIFAVGCERGVSFYAMQFIDGTTLADVIRELGRPAGQAPAPAGAVPDERTTAHAPADEVAAPKADTEPAARQATLTASGPGRRRDYFRRMAELGVQAAEALDHAHQAGVVHRDVKPGNLLLDGRGQLWVADFGLAHVRQGEAGLTMTGDLVGTLRYMSPEQALAKRVPIDHRTDVYSLGATLYELLTLRPAFEGNDRQELLRQIAFEEPKPPRRLNKAIPQELEVIVLKALEKNPADRYATAQEMADDLRRFLDDKPIRARRASWRQVAVKWARRHRSAVPVALAAGALTVVISVASALVLWGEMQEIKRANGATNRALVDKTRALDEKTRALNEKAQALAEKTQALYHVRIPLADRELADGFADRAETLLDACPPEARQWEWHYLKGRCRHRDLLEPGIPWGMQAAFSSDGQRIVCPSVGGRVVAWDMAAARATLDYRIPEVSVFLGVSPDGQRLAALDKVGRVKVWDATSGKERLALDYPRDRRVLGVTWPPDGRYLATWSDDGREGISGSGTDQRFHTNGFSDASKAQIWDTATGVAIRTLPQTDGPLAFSPDGHRLAGVHGRDSVTVWAVETGEEIRTFKMSDADVVESLAFSNQCLAVGKRARFGNFIELWDMTTGELLATLPGSCPQFSPDRQRLAYGLDGRVKLWDVNPLRETFSFPALQPLAFSPDGGRLACYRWGIKLWDVTNPPEAVVINVGGLPLFWVALSPDGRHAAAAQGGDLKIAPGALVIVDADTGRKVTLRHSQKSAVTCLAYSPDGRSLASACEDGTAKLWDAAAGQLLATLRGHTGAVWNVAYSPDGHRLATGSQDQTVKLWDVATGQELFTLRGHTAAVCSVAFSADGRRLVSAAQSAEKKVWDLQTGREVLGFPPERKVGLYDAGPFCLVAFSPDGGRIYENTVQIEMLVPGRDVRVWDATTGQELRDFGDSPPTGIRMAMTPDGQRIATTGLDGVKIWDARTGQELLTLRPKVGPLALAFSQDGTHLAAVDRHGALTIWDATPLPAAPGHEPDDEADRASR
jgi:WD40 repeat protein/serine/threonine protein kinase